MNEEKRLVTTGPDKREELPCLVVRLRRTGPDGKSIPGRHAWVQLQGIDATGEEHLYYSEAGSYTAVFYGVSNPKGRKFSLNVISLDAFKKNAETQNNAVKLLDLSAPSESDNGPRKEPLQKPTNQ